METNQTKKNLFCWFDWDDNTTSVNNLNIIKEPKKDLHLYQKGDEVVAKLPKYGLWNGVIVEISDSKKDLEVEMDRRQKLQLQQQEKCIESEEMTTSSTSSGAGKQPVQKKKHVDELNEEKLTEKRRKKDIDQKRLEVANKSLEDIIIQRRNQCEDRPKARAAECFGSETSHDHERGQNYALASATDGSKNYHLPIEQDVSVGQSRLISPRPPTAVCTNSSYTLSSNNFQTPIQTSPGYGIFSQSRQALENSGYDYPYCRQQVQTAFRQPATYSTLQSHAEQIITLQEENSKLKLENSLLKERITELEKTRSGTSDSCIGIEVTPRKVKFMQDLCKFVEKKNEQDNTSIYGSGDAMASSINQESQKYKSTVVKPTPRRLFNPTYSYVDHTEDQEDTNLYATSTSDNTTDEDPLALKEPAQEVDKTSLSTWKETVTLNGTSKIKLSPGMEVYLTPQQLSQAVQKAGNSMRKLVINLLEVFFAKETLAVSCAKGKRNAHNSTTDTKALPEDVVQAIKNFVNKHEIKKTGQSTLTDAVINDAINSKCATARRALAGKDRSSAVDWESK